MVCIGGNVLRAQDGSGMNNCERRGENTIESSNSRATLYIVYLCKFNSALSRK